jgi:hypothetical protein
VDAAVANPANASARNTTDIFLFIISPVQYQVFTEENSLRESKTPLCAGHLSTICASFHTAL